MCLVCGGHSGPLAKWSIPASASADGMSLRNFLSGSLQSKLNGPDLTDILNQRDREFIASELPVPAGLRTGSRPVVQAVGNAAMSAV